MGVFIFNACPKCDGPMRFNIDRDLDCFRCGKVVYLVGGFNDSRTGERGHNETETAGAELDKSNKAARGREFAYLCKVCGKEGRDHHIKDHIEANHLEGIIIPCNLCANCFLNWNCFTC